jgi:hypothetical protein
VRSRRGCAAGTQRQGITADPATDASHEPCRAAIALQQKISHNAHRRACGHDCGSAGEHAQQVQRNRQRPPRLRVAVFERRLQHRRECGGRAQARDAGENSV